MIIDVGLAGLDSGLDFETCLRGTQDGKALNVKSLKVSTRKHPVLDSSKLITGLPDTLGTFQVNESMSCLKIK